MFKKPIPILENGRFTKPAERLKNYIFILVKLSLPFQQHHFLCRVFILEAFRLTLFKRIRQKLSEKVK